MASSEMVVSIDDGNLPPKVKRKMKLVNSKEYTIPKAATLLIP